MLVRRLHVARLFPGEIPLDDVQARHARDVLRLKSGTTVEVFDDRGAVASGTLLFPSAKRATVRVEQMELVPGESARLIVASAVPKGERADWMVEKLSELGVFAFIPLAAARSVVLPQGTAKRQRWVRLAAEAAKQSRRVGVMRVDELTPLERVLGQSTQAGKPVLALSTAPDAAPIAQTIRSFARSKEVMLLNGPEGGWTPDEEKLFSTAGALKASLSNTILRTETAAIVAAAIVQALL